MLKIKSLYLLLPIVTGALVIQKFAFGDVISGEGEVISREILSKVFQDTTKNLKTMEEDVGVNGKWVNEKEIKQEEAVKAINRIKDYSIKISSECGSGTGWFLDYEIPKDNSYPLKWFIATNAHVINSFVFKENPYNQTLPYKSSFFSFRSPCQSREITLFRSESDGLGEWILNRNGIDSTDPRNWSNPYLRRALSNFDNKIARNANHTEEKWNQLSNIQIMYSKLQSPKLFYVSLNFLGKEGGTVGYYKDFAVLEVNFQSEREAKRITGDLFNRKEEERLNFFTEELMANKKVKELRDEGENYFSAGYPGNSYNEYKPFGNYSVSRNKASKLNYWLDEFALKNIKNQTIIGHVDTEKIDSRISTMRLSWGGKKYRSWGYNYSLDNMKLGPGASGSLVTNSKGEVLGLYRAHDSNNSFGFVEPLRSYGYFGEIGAILPRYDLIKGVPGQVNSYKQQLDRYMPNLNTYLRQKWNENNSVRMV